MKSNVKRSRLYAAGDKEAPTQFEKLKPYQLIEMLFEDRPNETYRSQKQLSGEINRHFKGQHSPITQPDVSKAFKRYEMYANVDGEQKMIYQINGVIKLFDAGDSFESLVTMLAKLNPFASTRVLKLNDKTFAFKLIPEKAEMYVEELKEAFLKPYGSDTIFSIIVHESLLVVMIDTELYDELACRMESVPAEVEKRTQKGKKKSESID